MRWRNTQTSWGAVAIAIHWLSAVVVLGMFVLGLWMTSLSYYDAWYHKAPYVHRSIGVLLFILTVARVGWRLYSPPPAPLASHKPWEQTAARVVHLLLYLLLFMVMVSGYLIATAEGRAIEVFGWFSVPATLYGIDDQEDVAGVVHLSLAWTLMALVALHTGAGLKHHLLDRDVTLRRMLGLKFSPQETKE